MRIDKKRLIPLMLGLTLVVGIIAVGISNMPLDSNAEESPVNFTATKTASVPNLDTEMVTDLNSTFVTIAEAVNPSVVTIFSDRVVQTQRGLPFQDDRLRDFFGDEFFDRFFSPRNPDGERRMRGMGSGVIVSEDGYIVTNNHVIRGADEIRVMLYGGEKVDAKIVGADAKTDIAVVKIDRENLNPLAFGNSSNLRVGEWVLAVGSPLSENLARTVTSGIVSATGRSNVGLADYEDFIQTDAAINPGNSGGALVNLYGELIGINTAIASQSGGFQGIGFAVPANMANRVMDALINEGEVVRGWLGVYIQAVDEDIAAAMNLPSADGALISSVQEDSPAERADLKSGDVVRELNGEKIEGVTELRNQIATFEPGTQVELTIFRDGEEKQVRVKLGELPDEDREPAQAQNSSMEKLGFNVQTLNEQIAAQLGYPPSEKGVVITEISQGSQAFDAGLRRGDVIKEVNKTKVTSAGEFSKRIAEVREKDKKVLILAKRGGNTFFAAFDLE